MSDDDERCVANPLADGACYHYDISVRPADQWARDEEFATVSSGGAGTRWMIADNLREAAALLDIGRPLEEGRPVLPGAEPPSDAVPLHPVPDVTEDEPLRRSRTEVRADAFREAADLVDVLTTSWRNTGGRDSANATTEVSKLLRGLARMEEERDPAPAPAPLTVGEVVEDAADLDRRATVGTIVEDDADDLGALRLHGWVCQRVVAQRSAEVLDFPVTVIRVGTGGDSGA